MELYVISDLAKSMLEELRLSLRISGDMYDREILTLAESAFQDMERVGVNEDYIQELSSRVRNAVICYVKAHFGYDNSEANRFNTSYRQIVIDMLNSNVNNAYAGLGGDGSEQV